LKSIQSQITALTDVENRIAVAIHRSNNTIADWLTQWGVNCEELQATLSTMEITVANNIHKVNTIEAKIVDSGCQTSTHELHRKLHFIVSAIIFGTSRVTPLPYLISNACFGCGESADYPRVACVTCNELQQLIVDSEKLTQVSLPSPSLPRLLGLKLLRSKFNKAVNVPPTGLQGVDDERLCEFMLDATAIILPFTKLDDYIDRKTGERPLYVLVRYIDIENTECVHVRYDDLRGSNPTLPEQSEFIVIARFVFGNV
jgi:hypothetical protein